MLYDEFKSVSLISIYHIFKDKGLNAHRKQSRVPRKTGKPTTYEATHLTKSRAGISRISETRDTVGASFKPMF